MEPCSKETGGNLFANSETDVFDRKKISKEIRFCGEKLESI